MSIFNSGNLNINDNEKMDKQLTDYCKSIGIQQKNICDSVIKNCIQNVNDTKLFDEEKFKFDNETEIENEKKCTLAWGRNMNEQVYNIIHSYNLKYLVKKRDTIIEDNLYSKEFTPEKWINKLVPNNLKPSILDKLIPNNKDDNTRIRSNRINNFNENKSFIFSKTLIKDILECNDNSKIGEFYLTIDHKNRELLINLFKKDKNNENYENLKTNINKFMNEIDINIKNLTYDDVVMLMYFYMNEKLPYTDVDKHLYTSKKKLICFIIKRFIQIYSGVENIQILDSVEEWCLYVHKNKSLNYLSVFDYVNKNIGHITHSYIYLVFDIVDLKNKLLTNLLMYHDLINTKLNKDLYDNCTESINNYCDTISKTNFYIKLLCKIFKLTNEDFIYNVFFYIVKKSIFEKKNKDYNNFLYYLFINIQSIKDDSPITESIQLIAEHANYGTYDDAIDLNKNTIKKYYEQIKPLKLITKEMVERLINNIRQINNKTEYQLVTRPIESAINIIIKKTLLVSTTDLASEMDIYKKLNTVQVQLPIEKAAIYDIRFILKNLPLFKKDLQQEKYKDYSWIYPIERVYSYYCDNVEKNNLRDVNEYFAKSIKLINGKPIMTTTYDDLLYLFNFFNEYNRRKRGEPIQNHITDTQFITNLKSELDKIKTRKKLGNIYNSQQINYWFYTFLQKMIRNENFIAFSTQILDVVIQS
ncbi:hypothetical protein N9T73_00330 [bacterium]|nr:hypothetical protein [bacterium]